MTGAALQALATVGRAQSGTAQRAVSWLRANQNGDGGFGQFKGRDSNSQSTSYAIQGLLAAGAGGATLSRARAYLVRLQRSDGSVAYSSSSAQTPVWVTAQALMALNGKPLPIATQPRSKRARGKAASDGGGGGAAAPGGGKAGSKNGKGGGRSGRGSGLRRRRRRSRGSRGRRDRSDGARRDGPGEHVRARGSGPRERGCEAEARAGVGRAARGSGPARAAVGDQPIRPAGALARHGIVRA